MAQKEPLPSLGFYVCVVKQFVELDPVFHEGRATFSFLDVSSTPLASCSLWASNFFATEALASAIICAARIPALVAPGLPMATVATGIPAGIWTVASKESIPCNDVEGIGTPITGNVVCAAITPAKCAAPPAPAMMIKIP